MRNLLCAVRCLCIVLFLLSTTSVFSQTTSNLSLSSALNPDGSMKSNVTGSFDSTGYRMSFGPNGEPRFVSPSADPLGSSCNDGWVNLGFTVTGQDATIWTVVADGLGNVYVGGDFSVIHNIPANRIAKWNGTAWSALGSGITGNGRIGGLAVSGTDVYVAGLFQTAGGVAARNVAKWNGSSWSALGDGVGGVNTLPAHAIAVSGTTVYAGGDFGIQMWNGSTWSNLGSQTGPEGSVQAIATLGTDVYVGGFFQFAGGQSSPGIAKFNGTTWSSLGTGVSPASVEAITISGSDVYVGGTFTSAGGSPASNIAKWNGTSWSALGSGVSARVAGIAISGSDVYVSGNFANAGGNPASRVAKWDGSQWSALGSGASSNVEGVAVLGSTVVIGGSFDTAGGLAAKGVAIWSSPNWTTFIGNNSLQGFAVRGIAVSGTDVYVAGNFTTAGSLTVNGIAKWNGSTWSALGTGVPGGIINAIAVSGNNVYVGGSFSNAGGTNANNIARWNGTSWSALGSGVSGGVVAVITIVGEDVYVGGSFANAGGSAANKIAKWNGTSWSQLNSGIIAGPVVAIAPAGNILYVGAGTTTVDSPNYFLKYENGTWTGLSAAMTGGGGVSSLAVSGSDIYVAGSFTSVGIPGTTRIAKWNNGTWSALGNGLPQGNFQNGEIKIAMSGSDVIAVGGFRVGAGGPADRIARWNGSAWLPMGAGLNQTGSAVAVSGGNIWVGGEFTSAGCYVSPYFAQWRETLWTGAASTDWHNAANWGGGTLPGPNNGVTIAASNATISTADVTVSSFIIANGRSVAIGAGRTLTVNGDLDLNNGSISGPGTLIVNGNLQMNGDITNLAALTVTGGLTINNGKITGAGPVTLTSCTVGALGGGNTTNFIESPLTRCVNSNGTFRFPVGTGTVYAPVEVSGAVGTGNFTIEAKSGAYSGAATGLPSNRLQRWWNTSATGITQANLVFTYVDAEIVGMESWYRMYRINAGAAAQLQTTVNQTTNRATVNNVTSFAAFTLAEGTPVPLTLSGRVTTQSGRGAWGVIVSLTDSLGNTRYTVTNPFGYYRFFNVPTFNTYTLGVAHKKFTFATPQRVVQFDELTPAQNFQASDH